MIPLKQSTAIDLRIGPFVDVGDGFTPETGVTIAASDEAEILKANGAATVTMAGAFTAVTGCDGWYDYTASTTDLDTVGELVVVMQDDSVYLPVFMRFYVVEEAVYDALYGASAIGPLQGTTAGNTLDVAATGEAGVDFGNILGTLDAANIGADAITAAKVADGTIDAATFAAGAINAAAIATDAIDADAIATDAVTEIRSIASGTATSGSTTTLVDAGLTEADDYWNGNWILFTSGTIVNQVRLITDFVAASDTITFAPATTLAVATNTYEILPGAAVDVQQWLETTVNVLVAGRVDASVGAMAASVLTAAALATDAVDEIVDAVFDEDIVAAHGTADTAGLLLRALAAVISQRTNNANLNALLGISDVASQDLPEQLLRTEVMAELAVAIPDATPTVEKLLMLLYMAIRDKVTSTSGLTKIFDDAGVAVAQQTTSFDGTTAQRDEMVAGT